MLPIRRRRLAQDRFYLYFEFYVTKKHFAFKHDLIKSD